MEEILQIEKPCNVSVNIYLFLRKKKFENCKKRQIFNIPEFILSSDPTEALKAFWETRQGRKLADGRVQAGQGTRVRTRSTSDGITPRVMLLLLLGGLVVLRLGRFGVPVVILPSALRSPGGFLLSRLLPSQDSPFASSSRRGHYCSRTRLRDRERGEGWVGFCRYPVKAIAICRATPVQVPRS